MRAVTCHQGNLEVAEVDDRIPGPGQILIEVTRAGICGSDLHARTHGDATADIAAHLGLETFMRSDQRVVMGHEFAGRVLEYGPRSRRRFRPGQSIVALPIVQVADRVELTGFSVTAPGAFAERVVVQESVALAVPNGLDDTTAAFTEPMAVALHAVRRGSVGRRDTCVVIGCGPIGLAVIAVLKATGNRTVVASDFSPARRELARQLGADLVVDPATESPWDAKALQRATTVPQMLQLGIDVTGQLRRVPLLPWWEVFKVAGAVGATPAGPVVFECVGVPGVIDQIVHAAPLRSRVVVVGVCMEPDRFQPAMALNKELDLRFAFGYDPGEFAETMRMLADGALDPSPMLTGTVGLDGLARAFEDLGDPERHAKIQVDPSAPDPGAPDPSD